MSTKSAVKMGSNRSFGLVFAFVFLVISLWPLINGFPIRIWSLALTSIFLILGLMNSKILHPLNLVWFKFGILLGSIIAPIVMGVVFFAVVTPTGLLMKLFRKDLLNCKLDKTKKSYWIKKENYKSSMKDQF